MFHSLKEFCKFKRIHPFCVFFTIKITASPVKTQQFILLFSTTCFSLKGHHQVQYKSIYIYIYIYILLILYIFYIYVLIILYSTWWWPFRLKHAGENTRINSCVLTGLAVILIVKRHKRMNSLKLTKFFKWIKHEQ
jgi:hypothetical protein